MKRHVSDGLGLSCKKRCHVESSRLPDAKCGLPSRTKLESRSATCHCCQPLRMHGCVVCKGRGPACIEKSLRILSQHKHAPHWLISFFQPVGLSGHFFALVSLVLATHPSRECPSFKDVLAGSSCLRAQVCDAGDCDQDFRSLRKLYIVQRLLFRNQLIPVTAEASRSSGSSSICWSFSCSCCCAVVAVVVLVVVVVVVALYHRK